MNDVGIINPMSRINRLGLAAFIAALLATPLVAQSPNRNGLHETCPKQTMLASVWMGTRILLSFSTRTSTLWPSHASHAPWVVT